MADQYAYPKADISVLNWFTAPIWSSLRNGNAVNTALGPQDEPFTVLLDPVVDPIKHAVHLIRATIWRSNPVDTRRINFRITLYQGSSVITSQVFTDVGSDETGNVTTCNYYLSASEMSYITNYSDLRLEFKANTVGSGSRSPRAFVQNAYMVFDAAPIPIAKTLTPQGVITIRNLTKSLAPMLAVKIERFKLVSSSSAILTSLARAISNTVAITAQQQATATTNASILNTILHTISSSLAVKNTRIKSFALSVAVKQLNALVTINSSVVIKQFNITKTLYSSVALNYPVINKEVLTSAVIVLPYIKTILTSTAISSARAITIIPLGIIKQSDRQLTLNPTSIITNIKVSKIILSTLVVRIVRIITVASSTYISSLTRRTIETAAFVRTIDKNIILSTNAYLLLFINEEWSGLETFNVLGYIQRSVYSTATILLTFEKILNTSSVIKTLDTVTLSTFVAIQTLNIYVINSSFAAIIVEKTLFSPAFATILVTRNNTLFTSLYIQILNNSVSLNTSLSVTAIVVKTLLTSAIVAITNNKVVSASVVILNIVIRIISSSASIRVRLAITLDASLSLVLPSVRRTISTSFAVLIEHTAELFYPSAAINILNRSGTVPGSVAMTFRQVKLLSTVSAAIHILDIMKQAPSTLAITLERYREITLSVAILVNPPAIYCLLEAVITTQRHKDISTSLSVQIERAKQLTSSIVVTVSGIKKTILTSASIYALGTTTHEFNTTAVIRVSNIAHTIASTVAILQKKQLTIGSTVAVLNERTILIAATLTLKIAESNEVPASATIKHIIAIIIAASGVISVTRAIAVVSTLAVKITLVKTITSSAFLRVIIIKQSTISNISAIISRPVGTSTPTSLAVSIEITRTIALSLAVTIINKQKTISTSARISILGEGISQISTSATIKLIFALTIQSSAYVVAVKNISVTSYVAITLRRATTTLTRAAIAVRDRTSLYIWYAEAVINLTMVVPVDVSAYIFIFKAKEILTSVAIQIVNKTKIIGTTVVTSAVVDKTVLTSASIVRVGLITLNTSTVINLRKFVIIPAAVAISQQSQRIVPTSVAIRVYTPLAGNFITEMMIDQFTARIIIEPIFESDMIIEEMFTGTLDTQMDQ